MSFEIEKKFVVGCFSQTLNDLSNDFGAFKHSVKNGFWWCNNHSASDNVLDISAPKFFKKDIYAIKDITEALIPEEDFQYIRLRIIDGAQFFMTFKIKSLVNNVEKNSEHEFELEKDTFSRVIQYLKDIAQIFYYNVKETWEFNSSDVKIELSKISDLKEAYLEVEVTGDNDEKLTDSLNKKLISFEKYNIKEEPKSYLELFLRENNIALKNQKLSQYSKKAFTILSEYI